MTVVRNDGKRDEVVVHKGPLHDHASIELFNKQYDDPSHTHSVVIRNDFRRNFNEFIIYTRKYVSTKGVPCSTKRRKVLDKDKKWVDTQTVQICGLSDSDKVLVNACLHIMAGGNKQSESQDANSFQNGSFEKHNTYTEIVKTTHQNKQDQKYTTTNQFVSKRRRRIRRRTKPPN